MPTSLPPFDFDLLRTFVAIVDSGGFTRAAARVGRTQSTVSLQIKRLEDGVGRRVFERAGKSVTLTPDGEILLAYARRMLQMTDDLRARLLEPDIAGRVRLGAPEDFVALHLMDALGRFIRAHPQIALDMICDSTPNLLDGFEKSEYDLVLFRCGPQIPAGAVRVWREPLVWTASEHRFIDLSAPLPLVLAPDPDMDRVRALAALESINRPWRIACTIPSLSGRHAAVRKGLGVGVASKETLAPGLSILGEDSGLPPLAEAEIALRRGGSLSRAAESLAEHILRSLEGVRLAPALMAG